MIDPRPAVLVTDTGHTTGLTVLRSLARGGWRVVATNPAAQPRWARSTLADAWYQVPSPEFEPLRSAEVTAQIARSEGVDLVFPTTDKSIFPIDSNRDLFGDEIAFALASSASLATARNKEATTALATSLGIPTPQSVTIRSSAEAEAAAAQVGWPVVIKPLTSHQPDSTGRITTRAVRHAANLEELLEGITHPTVGAMPLQIQQRVGGVGVGIELLLKDGVVQAAFQHRRLHEVPLSGGMSSLRVAEVPDGDLLEYSSRLLGAMKWDGLAMVEYKVADSDCHLLEVNGRVWGSIALPVRAGMDFPLLTAQQLFPETPGEPASKLIVEGMQCRNLELELRWLLAAGKRMGSATRPATFGEVARTAMALVDPRTQFDVQTLADWRPGVHDGLLAFQRIGSEIISKAAIERR